MSISKTRSALYLLARLLGDYQAARKGRIGKRLVRRVVGRSVGRALWRLLC